MSNLDSATLLAQMMQLHSSDCELGLERVFRLLDSMGNPHLRLPPVVHIAGTNGKGSTLAMMRAGFEAAGQAVHCYISPHLVRFDERITLAGQPISEAQLADVLARTLEANDGKPVTYFEAITCAAFLAFSETPADILILEVGMGGTGDTTNVLEKPALTIITPVSLDHQAYLGETLAEIAAEKAGILKRLVPCVLGPQADEALDTIEARAACLGVPLQAHGQHWHVWEERGRLVFQDETGLLDLPMPVLNGPHQIPNAGTAIAAMRHFGLGEDACAAAMTNARWPGRMQRLHYGPLVDAAPEAEIWLDGGHNESASQALSATLNTMAARPTHLVVAMLANRDPAEVLRALVAQAESLRAVPIPDEPKTLEPEALAHSARAVGFEATTAPSALDAVLEIVEKEPRARIVIFGTLYLAGALLHDNG